MTPLCQARYRIIHTEIEMSRSGTKSKASKVKPADAAPKALKTPKNLNKMRDNPKGDWKIKHVSDISSALGLTFSKPSSGSHYGVSSPLLVGAITVPARKPIKPVYIRKFVKMCFAHIMTANQGAENDKE